MEEKSCLICYDPADDKEVVEIPTPSYEPDKFAHRDCFLTKLEELASDATREKMLITDEAFAELLHNGKPGRESSTSSKCYTSPMSNLI